MDCNTTYAQGGITFFDGIIDIFYFKFNVDISPDC